MNSISDDDLRWLLALLAQENLAEIEVREEDCQVLVRAASTPGEVLPSPAEEYPAPGLSVNQIPVLSPVAGVFYRGSSPETGPFVEVGHHVEHGDSVGLIEAMKLFNEVPSPVSGIVRQILVENEQSVAEDQLLMIIEKGTEDESWPRGPGQFFGR